MRTKAGFAAVLLLGACSGGDDSGAGNASAVNVTVPLDESASAPAADGTVPTDAKGASAGGVADGSYSCHKLSGGMLVNMGTFRVSGGQVDTSVLQSAGATFKSIEPSAEGFRLNYQSKSGWAEVMDCEPE